MANVKISQLSGSAALTSDDFFPVVDSGSLTTKRASAEQILVYITGSTFDSLTVTSLTGTNTTGSLAMFTTITGSTVTGTLAKFTTISSSNSIVSGNLVLEGQTDLTAYPDYAYIIYTSSYDKLVAYPGLYVSGNLTGSGHAKFNQVSGTTAEFTEITASNINISGNIEFLQRAVIRNIASSSGDYFGASTLELIPDLDLSGSGQYLVIDPTSPNHIHIRAGGLIDSASAQLIVGGEKSNIIVRNLDNSYSEKHWVQITTTENVSSASFVWDFGNDGKLTLPGSITGSIAEFSEITGSMPFTANDPAIWSGSSPITVQEAINRIAAAVYSGNTGLIT